MRFSRDHSVRIVEGNALYEMERRMAASGGPESGHRLASCPSPALLSVPL